MFNIFNKSIPPTNHFPVAKLVKTTPGFVIDLATVQNRLTHLKQSLDNLNLQHIIAVSFKTNYEFASSEFPHQNSLWAETVSEHEYNLALKSKFLKKNIIINGPHKSNLSKYTSSIIHLDNFTEINNLKDINSTIGIRLNTNEVKSRFGFNIENGDAKTALGLLFQKNITVKSLHIHIGSDIYDPIQYKKTALKIADFINKNKLGLKYIDFGGGFPAHGATPHGQKIKPVPSIDDYILAISTLFKNINSSPTLILEPGRYLIDDATYFITRVINRQIRHNHQVITVDSTINMLPSLWYRPATIVAYSDIFTILPITKSIKTIIYGSSCQEHDKLFQGFLPLTQINDYLVFYAVGAYNQSMAPEFIFTKPKVYFS